MALQNFNISLDTIYACQDKKDDAKAGVKSITLILQNHVKIALGFFATALVSSWFICGVLTGSGIVYFFVTIVGGGFTLAYDLFSADLEDPKSCLRAVRLMFSATFLESSYTEISPQFQHNGFVVGPLATMGFFLDYLLSLS
jgi:4-hydroxybenzoate polyprenyltransferase